MNSYNENLNATVVASLQSLDLDEKNLKSQLNASMFTLYHAEGATITADDKLADSKKELKAKNAIKQIAVINTNISNNLVSSATQADQYLKQAITNAAVGASNVQIAANSIVRLASDIGSIFSIVNAADFDTDVFHQAETVAALMNDTAYEAEVASQIAMDSSKLASQVTSSIVLDKAKTSNASIKNLLKITAADYDTASQIVIADNATQAAVSANEKVAEGAVEDICIDYVAAKFAYYSTNADLNLNLTVNSATLHDAIDEDLSLDADSKTPALSFSISFNLLKTPFASKVDPKRPTYPVEDYYVFVVKESKKSTFSVSNAETLIFSDTSDQYISVSTQPVDNSDKDSSAAVYNGLQLSPDGTKILGSIYFEDEIGKDASNKGYKLHDTDNELIKIGEDYVVFVMASYYNDYKKTLNDFDDFLSAPSKSFCMKNKLQAVKNKDIYITTIASDKRNADLEKKFTSALSKSTQNDVSTSDDSDDDKLPPYSMQLTFDVDDAANKGKVEYRCIFLPEPEGIAKGMLTRQSLKTLIGVEYLGLQTVDDQGRSNISEKSTKDALQLVVSQRHSIPGFVFNLPLAEQVSAGNYIPAIEYNKPARTDTKVAVTATNKDKSAKPETTAGWTAFIGPNTTDNFGNLLVESKTYVAVIVSLASVSEDKLDNYDNNISDFDNGKRKEFVYVK